MVPSDDNTIYDDGYSNVRYRDSALNHCFSEYVSTRLNFDITYYIGEYIFEVHDTNIKNLSNLIELMVYDYKCSDNAGIVFEDGLEIDACSYRTKFSKDMARELFDAKKYEECFTYIIDRLDYIYVNFNNQKVKLSYSLLSNEALNVICSDEFTEEYFGFEYSDLMSSIDQVVYDEDGYESLFCDYTVGDLIENINNPFVYSTNINDAKDFIDVYRGYVKAAYIDLVFKETRTVLVPSVVRENVFDDRAFFIANDIRGQVYDLSH